MKKGISNILVLVLVLINLILTAILMFTVLPQTNKTNKLIDKICEIVDLDVGEGSGNGSEDTVTVADLESVPVLFGTGEGASPKTTITVMSTDGKAHHMQIGVIINLNTKHKDYNEDNRKLIDSAMSNISSTITSIVSDYEYTEISRENMAADILQALRTLFGSEFIYSIEFDQWVIT